MRFFRSIFYFLLILIAVDSASAQGMLNVQFIGQVRTRGTGGYSNCWGYNAPNGREYAIMGCFGGTQIVDITSDTLKEVAFIPGPNSNWREMKVYQQYAYVVTEGTSAGAGVQIIDLSNLPDTAILVNTYRPAFKGRTHSVSIEGKFLYLNGGDYKVGGIVVLDLTDPVNPVFAGEYEAQYVHDCVVKNDTIYAAAVYGQGIDIIDATNKSNMKRVSITNYPYSGTHNTDLSADKRYVFSTDEINSDPGGNGNILRVWDRSDVSNLKLVGTYVAKSHTIVHNIHVKGNYGYLSHYSEGLRILDLAYPEIPVEVAYYDSFVGSVNSYVGAWGTFPYFTSNKVIISDMSGGLFVIRFAGQNGTVRGARGIITVRDSATNQPLNGVKIVIAGRPDTLLTDTNGKLKLGSLSDTVGITFILASYSGGYKTKTQNVVLSFDSVALRSIGLSPNQTGSLTVNVADKTTAKSLKNISVKILNTPVAGTTDTSGKFSVPSLTAGSLFSIVAAKWGFKSETLSVNISPNIVNTVNFQLTHNGLDDFETDKGWTVGSPKDSGVYGRWQRGTPLIVSVIGDIIQPGSDHSANGSICYVTGAVNTTNDNVEGRTTLTSPAFDAVNFTHPALLFWMFTNTRANPIDDTVYVELSNDNGQSWITAKTVAGKHPQWTQHRIALKDFITVSEEMKVRFVARDGGVASLFDVSVDDIEIGDNLQLSVEKNAPSMPKAYSLYQNYPNPFNPSTTIRYQNPTDGFVALKVFDLLGKEVATLVNEHKSTGSHSIVFNGKDLSSGVYFYKLQAGNFVETKKLILAK